QIREATTGTPEENALPPTLALAADGPTEELEEEQFNCPPHRSVLVPIKYPPDSPLSLAAIVRGRLVEQFGVLSLGVVPAVVLAIGGLMMLLIRWRERFLLRIGATASEPLASPRGLVRLGELHALVIAELTTVLAIFFGLLSIRLVRRMRTRRFKIRP